MTSESENINFYKHLNYFINTQFKNAVLNNNKLFVQKYLDNLFDINCYDYFGINDYSYLYFDKIYNHKNIYENILKTFNLILDYSHNECEDVNKNFYLILQSMSLIAFILHQYIKDYRFKHENGTLDSLEKEYYKKYFEIFKEFYLYFTHTLITIQNLDIQDNQFVQFMMDKVICSYEYSKEDFLLLDEVKNEAQRINMDLNDFKIVLSDFIDYSASLI
jgi:hypothetical protein